MKINKYLKELGFEWYDLPGTYQEGNENIKEISETAAGDCRNWESEEGFCGYEFFNLDFTLSLFIYSKLCFFREFCADYGTPSCICYHAVTEEEHENAHKFWLNILDEMIEGFKLSIAPGAANNGINNYKVNHARRLLAEYWDCLWY